MSTEELDLATTLVLQMLTADRQSNSEIVAASNQVAAMLNSRSGHTYVDATDLARVVEAKCNVFVPNSSAIENTVGHVPWLPTRQLEIDWRYWDRYRRFLKEKRLLEPRVVDRLAEVTDDLLKRLEDPDRPGPWDRRGLLVGHVQSGKTANYIGLACKAADAGYRLIIILAGIHNSLRSQTQLRLDEGLVGYDTQKRPQGADRGPLLGVGRLLGENSFFPHVLTNSSETGDFSLKVASQMGVALGGDPVLLVVKKNATILRNVQRWATSVRGVLDDQTGRMVVPDIPLLLIDDEADYASVNTNKIYDAAGQLDDDLDPTRINGLIRKLLISFEKRALVGYTATPFANIYIPSEQSSDEFGPDLFPESFIINMEPPSNYLGPDRVFGLQADPDAGVDEVQALPLTREVDDHAGWVADRHKTDWIPGPLPRSLSGALKSFVLTCAIRALRESKPTHNSMLVHVTRFTAVQARVTEQISDELKAIQNELRYGSGSATETLLRDLEEIWLNDVLPTTADMRQSRAFPDEELLLPTWEEVRDRLLPEALKIEVRRINGTSHDALDYFESREQGLSVIAVGGDKLSRGLTLEGLTVSYLLRASKMYDTLMQMGRWFGYKPGYADLCRLYTTGDLLRWYRSIAVANEELRAQFDEMAANNATPREYGLRVMNSSDGLMITAATKMRSGVKMRVSYSASVVETISFYGDEGVVRGNLEATEEMLRTLGAPSTTGAPILWNDVGVEPILGILSTYVTHEDSRKVQGGLLRKYIESRVESGELSAWTVALISGGTGPACRVGEYSVKQTLRQWDPYQRLPVNDRDGQSPLTIRRLLSPKDEGLDLDKGQRSRALARTKERWEQQLSRAKQEPTIASGPAFRHERSKERGLLILYPLIPPSWADGSGVTLSIPIMGFGMSFPRSARDEGVEYTVNNVYWELEVEGT